jgi:hypothetical protein
MLSTQTSFAPAIPECVTHAAAQFLPCPDCPYLALITLDNGEPRTPDMERSFT